MSPSGERIEVLRKISLKVPKGQFVTVLGPSGCGKTTLLKLVAGLVVPSFGRILVDQIALTRPSCKLGYVPQAYSLFPWLTVSGNIEYGLRQLGTLARERQNRVDQMLSLVGLVEFRSYYPRSLSGGMQQRVAIARALAPNPDILLMDEPFAALAIEQRQAMQVALQSIWMKTGKTIIFVTHDLSEAIYLSDTVYVMSDRPGSLIGAREIPLPRPREIAAREGPEFFGVYKELVSLTSSSEGFK